ncbi:MAG: GNAT family N-acetyltransferase [Candidatus Heimdallarchaeota archaeon]
MVRKRTIFSIIIIATSIIVQLFGIPYLGVKFSSHDIEFDYIYNWDLKGTGGWYEGYSETFRSSGTYTVDFSGNVASVSGRVSWSWSDNYGASDSDNELYLFTYSLINGSYLVGSDQDYNTSGMNVWFHIPGGFSSSQYSILDTNYSLWADSTVWVGHLMPFLGKRIHSQGTYYRNSSTDVYGDFTVNYIVDDYFTSEGYLIAEIYYEEDEGYDGGTGYWSEFTLNSILFITSSSYIRFFNIGMYLLAYWFPIFCIVIIFFVIYEKLRWKPVIIHKEPEERDVIVERGIPPNVKFSIESAYSDIIPSYLVRARSQGKGIISAHNASELLGIGFIEPNGKIGTFYGNYTIEMIRYTKVKYAFTEIPRIFKFKVIEIYDIFQINNLQTRDFTFDTNYIKPTTPQHIQGIMRMVANEDTGRKNPRYAKWVENSYEDDISVVATSSTQDTWIKHVLSELRRHNYPKPELIVNEVIMGVGFATPGQITGWLYGLYVHPAFRNRGIGKMLVFSRLSALKGMGCGSAITEIAEWNSPAKKIYEDIDAIKIGKIHLLGKKMPKVKVRRY